MLDVDHGIWFLVVSCMEKVTSTCLYVGYFIWFFLLSKHMGYGSGKCVLYL